MNYSISFTAEQLQYVVKVLELRPFNEVAALLMSIKQQATDPNAPDPKTPDNG